jgi:hypothetical protein
MRVFKFGGASVKNAAAVRNVAEILKQYPDGNLVNPIFLMMVKSIFISTKSKHIISPSPKSYFHTKTIQSIQLSMFYLPH